MFIIDHQIPIRLFGFLGIFFFMTVWEIIAPRRTLRVSKPNRWSINLSLTFLNALISRFVFSLSATGSAILAGDHGWGILNYLHVPSLAAGIISIILLDLVIYLQHLFFHKIRIFWFIHGMHHTDLDIDVTTGARFHPFEIVLSLLIKIGVILLFGIPAWAFIIFEVLLNGTSMFNHSNVSLSTKIDRFLRYFLVTPDMHRVHHSVIIREYNSNFGFSVPWWDWLFGTYKSQPEAGHDAMVIGLANFRDPGRLSFLRLILLPFLSWRKL